MDIDRKQLIKISIKKGFLQIFSANFINKVIQFGITIVLTRILDKSTYGSFVYAQNILNLFLLLEGFGSVSGVLQYCSVERKINRKVSFFKYGLKIGILANSFIALAILIFTLIFELPVEGSTQILMYFCVLPLFTILFNEIQVFLRSNLNNKEFSILSVTNTLLYFLGNIALGIVFSIKGIILGRYIAYFVSIVLGIYFIRKYIKNIQLTEYPSVKEKKEFLIYSIVTCLTNSISSILYLLDTFLVGIIIKDAGIVATYKNATLIPFNLNFIPSSIMIFAYPYFARNSHDKEWIKDKYIVIMKYLSIVNIIISIICIIFAPQIITIIFGKKYLDSIVPFRILSFGYFITGTFRIPAGNIIASIKKVKVNFYTALISGISNIILDILLILKYGYNGAAIATVLVFVISSLIANMYLKQYLFKIV